MRQRALPRRLAAWIAASLVMAGCSADPDRRAEASASTAVPVVVQTPRPASTLLPVPAIGRLERAEESTLGFLSGGVVDRIDVDIGDVVRKGQVLATQTPTTVDAALQQAQEQQAQAQRDRERAAELVQKQLLPRQVLDDATTRLIVAEAQVRSAVFAARNARIVAPADGVVRRRLAEPGEVVGAGAPILVVSGGDAGWRLRATVADRDGLRLRVGDRASIRIDAIGGLPWPATVSRIGGEADAASGGIAVDLALSAPAGEGAAALRSGLVASARIDASADTGLAVPTSALVAIEDGRGRVFVARDGRAVPLDLRLGEVGSEHVRVLEGLDANDAVVVEGAAYLAEGTPVSTLSDGAP
ncbi:MAG: efflux RND transporter periplasmic adaptor subunit [Lysobacteraceae bacterium]|jgi:RND family efflux transporter MFP subunit|nr:efflux RND transporter periplasmic adaptor subunit [Xanthomonadaceae bacterium]MCZ8317444.1 efflux RND transporter periplasmic adaptor subunit [Silanimonas sp.]